MLPDLRFVFGALMVIAVTGMIGVGLFVSAKLFHQAKTGPVESRRSLALTGGSEWNQFYDAGSVRRYVGLARQGEAREVNDLPPDQNLQESAPAMALAPAELPDQQSGPEAIPMPVRAPVAESAAGAVVTPVERMSAVAEPSRPDQAREAPVAERTAVADADAIAESKPRQSDTVVAHAVLMPIGIVPSADVQRLPVREHFPPGSTEAAVASTADPESRRDPEQPDTTPGLPGGVSEPAALAGRTETAIAATAATALPPPPDAPTPAAAQPQAARAKPVVSAPRAPVGRVARDDDDDERPRAAGSPRSRALASRGKAGPPGAQANGLRRADPRQHPPGQPVFGPHFPYASPQSNQPHFGPHFPYATPQASRRAAARAPRQPSFGPAYGWR
jgi:hypothetical protein